MSILATVTIANADTEKFKKVEVNYPELSEQLRSLLQAHGNIGHRRFFHGNEVLDIDEWESVEGFEAFLAEARPLINKLAELRGSDIPVDRVWYPLG